MKEYLFARKRQRQRETPAEKRQRMSTSVARETANEWQRHVSRTRAVVWQWQRVVQWPSVAVNRALRAWAAWTRTRVQVRERERE